MEATRGTKVQPLGGIDPEECTREFMPLVRRMARIMKRRLPCVVGQDDLVQFGLLGLLQAAQRYNGPREEFRYFARPRIRGAIIDGLRETDSAPRRLRRNARHLRLCVSRLEQALSRAPTGREIAAEMQLTLAQYHRLVQEQDAHKSVDPYSAEQHEVPFQDSAAQADPLYLLVDQCNRRRLLAALSELPERLRRMLKLRLDDGLELRRIAVLFGVTESRVCQLLRDAAARVRSRMAEPSHYSALNVLSVGQSTGATKPRGPVHR
jgi:RNA polymerase sigma factor for flagellar operon FliA